MPSNCMAANSARYASRSTGGTPAPRSSRVGNVSAKSRHPVAAAADRYGSRRASPPKKSTAPSGMVPVGDGTELVIGGAGSAPSDQEASAGRISVATSPPSADAAALAASPGTAADDSHRRNHRRTLPATSTPVN